MASAWDTTALLASIRRRARSTNSAAPGYGNADLLEMANEELTSKLVPELIRLRRDWFEVVRDTPLVVGNTAYPLWTRSIMGSARDIGIVSGGVFRRLSYLPPEAMDGKDPTNQAGPSHYTIRGTDVILYPAPNIADTLRVTCLRRLNRLVLPAAVAVATGSSVNTSNQTSISTGSTLASLGITTSTPCDLVRGVPPFSSVVDDVTPIAIAAGTVAQFAAAAIPTTLIAPLTWTADVVAGDYLCLAGQSPVIQGPPEMLAILAQRVANALLRPGRDKEILAAGERELAQLEAAVFGVADHRVESDIQTVGSGPWL